jgi:glycerophosphoryl diester phosphodiesterase
MFSSLPEPVIFAHRGASSHAPENTLAAFQLAIEQGATAIELDVQLTADQEVVVFHDLTLDRTTNGHGKLKEHNLSDLKRLNASLGFEPAYQNERIPTLADVFDKLPRDIFINIELKNLNSPFDPLPEITAGLISGFHSEERVLISSFNPAALRKFQRSLPGIPCGRLLYSTGMIRLYELLPFLSAKFQSIHLPYSILSRSTIRTFQERGLKVFAYTLNHPQDIINAVSLGIDGFFTDDPAFANRLLEQNNLSNSVGVELNKGF